MTLKKPSEEYWDLYRADGRFEKVIPARGYDIPANMYHMTVEVIPTDKAGHLLITQRSFQKKIGPGKMEFPAGSVLSEEQPFVAARRELFEETGLKAASIQKLGEYVIPRVQRTVYLAYVPNLLNAKITLREGETIGYAIVTYKKWLEIVAQERFETSKFRCYNSRIFRKLESLVGAAEEEPEEAPRKLKKLKTDPFAAYRTKQTDATTGNSEEFTFRIDEEEEMLF